MAPAGRRLARALHPRRRRPHLRHPHPPPRPRLPRVTVLRKSAPRLHPRVKTRIRSETTRPQPTISDPFTLPAAESTSFAADPTGLTRSKTGPGGPLRFIYGKERQADAQG